MKLFLPFSVGCFIGLLVLYADEKSRANAASSATQSVWLDFNRGGDLRRYCDGGNAVYTTGEHLFVVPNAEVCKR